MKAVWQKFLVVRSPRRMASSWNNNWNHYFSVIRRLINWVFDIDDFNFSLKLNPIIWSKIFKKWNGSIESIKSIENHLKIKEAAIINANISNWLSEKIGISNKFLMSYAKLNPMGFGIM